MKRETWRGQNSAQFIYLSYKDSPFYSVSILAVTVLAIFMLLFTIVLPQAQNWFSIRDESIATQDRINTIKSNISYMSLLDKAALENNRQTVVSALPAEKDFAAIINAVGQSSINSGVSVDDFTFGLGAISSSSAQPNEPLDTISLSLSLDGSINNVKNFIKEISEKLPVSEVKSVDTGTDGTSIILVFYSKAYRVIDTPADQQIQPISVVNGSLLGKISGWKTNGGGLQESPARTDTMPIF